MSIADALATLATDLPVRLVQVTALLAVLLVVDRVARRRLWPQLLAVLWWLVPLRALLPSHVGGAWTAETVSAATTGAEGFVATAATSIPWWLVAWLTGSVVMVALATRRRLRATRRVLAVAEPPRHEDAVREALGRLHRDHPRLPSVPVLRSPAASGPMVVGLIRPVVVLPADDADDPADLVHVLLHELEHIRRRDPLRRELVLLGTALLWFHPLAWLARHRVEQLREVCCDVAVSARLGDHAAAYRRTLLRTARDWLPAASTGLGWISPRHPLLERVDWIERQAWRHPLRRRLASIAATGLVVACAMPAVHELAPTPATVTASQPELETARSPETAQQIEAAEQVLARSAAGEPGCLQARYAAMFLHQVRAEATDATAREETSR